MKMEDIVMLVFCIFLSPFKFLIVLKKGRSYKKNGYIVTRRVFSKNEFQHRIVAMRSLGRKLKPWEEVHHLDHRKNNNDPRNLCVMNQMAHYHYHKWATWMHQNHPRKLTLESKIRRIKTKYPKSYFVGLRSF